MAAKSSVPLPTGLIHISAGIQDTFKAVELTEDLLSKLTTGTRILLKANGDEPMVLCTADQTYSITMIENSNTILLMEPPSAASAPASSSSSSASAAAATDREGGGSGSGSGSAVYSVRGRIDGVHELARIAPPLHRLHELLSKVTCDAESLAREAMEAEAQGEGEGEGEDTQAVVEAEADGDAGGRDDTQEAAGWEEEDAAASSAGGGSGIGSGSGRLPPRKRRRRGDGDGEGSMIARGSGAGSGEKWVVGYSFRQLRLTIQCSDAELLAALRTLHAVCLRGTYRLLAPAYAFRVLQDILMLVQAEDWDVSSLPLSEVVSQLDQHEAAVVAHVCAMYGTVTTTPPATAADAAAATATAAASGEYNGTVALDFNKVAVAQATLLLQGNSDPAGVPQSTFLQQWRDSTERIWPVNPIPQLSIEQLRDRVLLDTNVHGVATLRYFPADRLSPEPATRFEQLFAVRKAWLLPDLLPFLAALEGAGRKVGDMILAFTRTVVSADGKTKTFTAR